MAIKVMGKSEIAQHKLDVELKQLNKLQEELLNQIKGSIGTLIDLDYLYELQEYIEDLIVKWEETEFELEEDD
jgi:hypothetical protein